MKIHSKFKDYYDTISAYGHDEKCHYVRKQKDHFVERERFPIIDYMPEPSYGMDLSSYVVGFCGKIYPVYVAHYYEQGGMGGHKTEFLYSAEEVREYLKRRLKKREFEYFMESDQHKRWKHRTHYNLRYMGFSNEGVEAFFEKCPGSTKYDWVFNEYKVPLWVLRKHSRSDYEITINCKLRDFGFAKIKDPYQAYQDIYTFITMRFGVGEPETVKISDEDMRDAKGFDDWSFKKLKTKPKGKRRKNRV